MLLLLNLKIFQIFQCCPHIETSQLIFTANQLTGFYMRAALALNELNKKLHFLLTTKIQSIRAGNYRLKVIHKNITLMLLIHFKPLVHFYTPRKYQKTAGFLVFSGVIEREHLTQIGLK